MADLQVPGVPAQSQMRERILAMAAGLFIVQGYSGISMREIAEACGLSKAGLYYHFKDKEDLFLAILAENLTELGRIMSEVEQQPGRAQEKIRFFVRAIFTRMQAERRAIIRLASQEMNKITPEARADFIVRYEAQFTGRLAAIIAAGVETGELQAVDGHLAAWGLLGLMYPFFNRGSDGPEEVIQFIEMVFLEGVTRRD